MPGRDDCASCDFRDRPEVCYCLVANLPRVCTLAHELGREDYRDLIRRRTLDASASPEAVASAREGLAVNRCKVRQANRCGCADRSALCYRSGLPAVVSREHCGRCVNRAG